MIARSRQAVRLAMESSRVIQATRRVTADSMLVQAIVAAVRWSRRTRDRIVAGVKIESPVAEQRRTTERLATVAGNSRVVATLSTMLNAPLLAFREAGVTGALHPLLGLDLQTRVRLTAWILVTAVLTHTMLFAVLGVPVHTLGWSVRAALMSAGLVVAWRPTAAAAAWRDRVAATRENHGDA